MFYYEVSRNKRLAQVASAIFWCLFAAGPMFGFAALKPFLIEEHVYEDICTDTSAKEFYSTYLMFLKDVSTMAAEATPPKCVEQDLKLNLIFTICAVLTNISALAIGYLLDNYGPRLCGFIGATFILMGTIIVINSAKIFEAGLFDPFLFGYGLVALGGPFTFITSFHLSNAFPKNSGLVLALLTGAFDASSSVFLIYSIIHNTLLSYGVDFKISEFFKIYLIVPLFIFTVQTFLLPKTSYQIAPAGNVAVPENSNALIAEINQEVNETTSLLPKTSERRRSSLSEITRAPQTREEEVEEEELSGGIFGILHGKTIKEQFGSWWFVLLSLYTTIQMLRLNYFISTINSQYTYLFHSHVKATKLNKIFDVALPMGGLLSIPFVGYFLDNFSTFAVVGTLTGLSLTLGVLGFIPNSFFLGVCNALLFVVYRPFFYTTISDLTGKIFGFETFGIIYGTIMSISGIMNFGQSYFDKLTHTVFKMNPGPINYILVSCTLVIGSLMVGYIRQASASWAKEKKNGDEEALE